MYVSSFVEFCVVTVCHEDMYGRYSIQKKEQ